MSDEVNNGNSDNYSPDYLDRLATILNYELSSALLFGLSFFASVLIIIAILIAGLFVPYLIYTLLKEGRHGWIIFFNVLVPLPLLFSIIFIPSYFSIFILIALAMFYVYCFLLRITINDWISERNWRIHFLQQKEKKRRKELE